MNKIEAFTKIYGKKTDEVLSLIMDDVRLFKWYIDGSYGLNYYFKIQNGVAMTMGKRNLYGTSQKQKINTTSSTETDLVDADEVLPQVFWNKYFLEEHGYD